MQVLLSYRKDGWHVLNIQTLTWRCFSYDKNRFGGERLICTIIIICYKHIVSPAKSCSEFQSSKKDLSVAPGLDDPQHHTKYCFLQHNLQRPFEPSNQNTTDWVTWAGTSGDWPDLPAQSRVNCSRLHRAVALWALRSLRMESPASGQLVLVFNHPQSKRFGFFKWNFLFFSFCPLISSCQWTSLRSALLHLLYSSQQVFIHIDMILLSLLTSKLNNTRSFNFSSHDRWSSLLIIFMELCWKQYVHFSLVLGSPELSQTLHMCLISAE